MKSAKPMTRFNFTALPRCVVTEKPMPCMLKQVEMHGRMIFVIIDKVPDPRKTDTFIDGFLSGCGMERSEYISMFFNDTGYPFKEAQDMFEEKYKNMKFPECIEGYTTVAKNRSPNLLSSFLGKKPVEKQPEAVKA